MDHVLSDLLLPFGVYERRRRPGKRLNGLPHLLQEVMEDGRGCSDGDFDLISGVDDVLEMRGGDHAAGTGLLVLLQTLEASLESACYA